MSNLSDYLPQTNDTLDTVTDRGATTTNDVTVGDLTADEFIGTAASAFVGTVAASGNTSIIESGSNANGYYVKFVDGTMICWNDNVKSTLSSNSSSYGSLWLNEEDWTFPQTFISKPLVTVGQAQMATGASWGAVDDISTNTTSARLRALDIVSRTAGSALRLSATAIGRWK